jgi:hypothetical protein
MHCFVAAGCPTRPAPQETRVIAPTDQDDPGSRLLLEMALQAERVISLRQHFLIH